MRVFVQEPPEPVVTWDDANAHLKLDGETSQQEEVEAFIAAATGHLDGPSGWLGRAIGPQTLELRLDHFAGPACRYDIRLPYGPIIEVLSVKYVDSSGAEQTLDPSAYELLGDEIVLAFGETWPTARLQREAVRIRYRAGYETLPAPLRAAILLMTGDLYRNRDTVSAGASQVMKIPMSTTVENLVNPFRQFV